MYVLRINWRGTFMLSCAAQKVTYSWSHTTLCFLSGNIPLPKLEEQETFLQGYQWKNSCHFCILLGNLRFVQSKMKYPRTYFDIKKSNHTAKLLTTSFWCKLSCCWNTHCLWSWKAAWETVMVLVFSKVYLMLFFKIPNGLKSLERTIKADD